MAHCNNILFLKLYNNKYDKFNSNHNAISYHSPVNVNTVLLFSTPDILNL